jgi:Zn-dependent protease
MTLIIGQLYCFEFAIITLDLFLYNKTLSEQQNTHACGFEGTNYSRNINSE